MNYFYISIFAFMGAISRYSISLLFGSSHHQLSTIFINIMGSFFIIIASELLTKVKYIPNELITGITIGFFGAFTTFSIYSYESLEYLLNQQYIFFLFYSLGSVIVSLLAAWSAYIICNKIENFRGEPQ